MSAKSPDFDTLQPGDTVAERELHFTRETLVRYAGASGDFNPIHYRDDIATAVGLPGVIAHGMLTMGAAASVVTDWLGAAGEVRDYQTRFTRMVPVAGDMGATVTVTAVIGARDEAARTARIDLTVSYDAKTVLGKSQMVVAFG